MDGTFKQMVWRSLGEAVTGWWRGVRPNDVIMVYAIQLRICMPTLELGKWCLVHVGLLVGVFLGGGLGRVVVFE